MANDGLDKLRQRLERKARSVPPPRNPRPSGSDPELLPSQDAAPQGDATPADPPAPQPAPPTKSERPPTRPGEPVANLAIRVRQSLDDRLGEIVHGLKRDGIHTSKAELVELLLWELPPTATDGFRRRLATFRQEAPRERPL